MTRAALLLLALASFAAPAAAQEDASCLKCHADEKELAKHLKDAARIKKVLVDPRAFKRSVHASQGCANCHGGKGEGMTGPSLQGIGERMAMPRIVQWIKNPSEKMPKLFPQPLDHQSVKNVAAYVHQNL